MIIIIDYDAGNTHSIANACKQLGFDVDITSDHNKISNAKKLIIPGQGAFRQAMNNLENKGLIEPIKKQVKKGVPFFGICLGFQILFESSTEHENSIGLGLLPGNITKIQAADLKIPHMGWNSCKIQNNATMFNAIETNTYFYFVHSFCLYNTQEDIISSTTSYSSDFISAVQKENIWGTQFHPEKSSTAGLKLLNNFLSQSD